MQRATVRYEPYQVLPHILRSWGAYGTLNPGKIATNTNPTLSNSTGEQFAIN